MHSLFLFLLFQKEFVCIFVLLVFLVHVFFCKVSLFFQTNKLFYFFGLDKIINIRYVVFRVKCLPLQPKTVSIVQYTLMNKISTRYSCLVLAAVFCLLSLPASAISSGDLVISKVFYAGSTEKGGTKTYSKGQFIELFNNSDKDLDLSGLYIALVESEASTGAYTANIDATGIFVGNAALSNKVAVKQLFRIPVSAAFVLPARNSVVIANTAIDHTPLAEVGHDLSQAGFEFGDPTGAVADNEAVPNMEVVYTYLNTGKANDNVVNMLQGGDCSLMILDAKLEGKFNLETDLVFANGKETGNRYLPLNTYYALDCVDLLKVKKQSDESLQADPLRKRFAASLDAGYASVQAVTGKNGEVLYRRTAVNNDGALTLMDTNNSSQDFASAIGYGLGQFETDAVVGEPIQVVIPESGVLPFFTTSSLTGKRDSHLSIMYINGNSKNTDLTYNTYLSYSIIKQSGPCLLVGEPGEHVLYTTPAQPTVKTSGICNWATDTDERFQNGVVTTTLKNRQLYRFANEAGNLRFVRDEAFAPVYSSLTLPGEDRFYLSVTNAVANAIAPTHGATGYTDLATIKFTADVPSIITTDIGEVPAGKIHDEAVYDLCGRKLSGQPTRGIYVRGGRTFVVK